MRFDDRLRTVLDQPALDPHDRAVRWRQLVDLLARAGQTSDSPLFRAGLQVVRDDAASVDDQLREAAARAIAAFPLPFELICLFASHGLKIAAPILAAANLPLERWTRLLDWSDEETRTFILALHPDADHRNAPEAGSAPVSRAVPESQVSISEVIARIEQLREQRERGEELAAPQARQPLQSEPVQELTESGEGSRLFRWECNGAGEIVWVEGAPRGALIGYALVDPAKSRDGTNDAIARAFAIRAPFRNAVMTLGKEYVLAGDWQVSGVPAFELSNGRFAGYRGVARRAAPAEPEIEAPHPDSLRELVHEIKTPLNAIMGFAEIIEQQMFGPADVRYRERAAEIVSQSHLLLGALNDLDFAAKSRSATSPPAFVNLGELVERLTPDIRELARPRGIEIARSGTTRDALAAVDPAVAEQLIRRMCAAIVNRGAAGERLRLVVEPFLEDRCRIAITRPAALWGLWDERLFDGEKGAEAPAPGLRLTRGLAQIAGGDLITSADMISLVFARATLGSGGSHVYGSQTGQGL